MRWFSSCRRYAVLEDLCCQEELWEEVSRLHTIREEERETDRIFSETEQLEKPPPPAAVEKLAVSTPNIKVSATSGEWKGWKLATSGTKRKAPLSPKGLQLQNRFTALKAEEKPCVPSSRGSGPPDPKPCNTTRKKQ